MITYNKSKLKSLGTLLSLTGVKDSETTSAPIYSLKNQPGISVVVADFELGPIDLSILINQGVALFDLSISDPESEDGKQNYKSKDIVSHENTIIFNTLKNKEQEPKGIKVISEKPDSLYVIDMITSAINDFNDKIKEEIEEEDKIMAALYV
ncbi:hypothetical protein [Vibrio splendidus]|uniref:hypothetical protein n=1 Tax=Vibrio splendidus TaxID=29497 RepID=UPI003D118E4C